MITGKEIEGFAVISGSYEDPATFNYISDVCKERYGHYTKAHHSWINDIESGKFREALESVRQNAAILTLVEQKFPNSTVYPVTEGDEIYWSASPKDALGSDRSLVDCHYDAPFAAIPTGGVTYYRVIIAMNENNTVTTVFPDEDKKVKMSTGDFHGLDYNKDWHCVEGSIPSDKYRVLLKLHYLIVPEGSPQMWVDWVRFINLSWTKLSRETMRMSANPQTLFESFVGLFVNICRYVFNHINIIALCIVAIVCIILGAPYVLSFAAKSSRKR